MTAEGRKKLLKGGIVFLFLLAVFLRFYLCLKGTEHLTVRLCRPDTPTYLEPAAAMVRGEFCGTGRAPGFIVLAALLQYCFDDAFYILLPLVLTLISCLTLILIYCAGKTLGGKRTGIAAALLAAFNPTAIANAPMLLSDTFFAFFAALAFLGFCRFYKTRDARWFAGSVFAAALGALIRPINLPWIFPALVWLWLVPQIAWKQKAVLSLAGTAIFFAVLLPWMARNAAAGAGWCIDTNTGAMLHQNGAMILAESNHTSYEEEKQKIREQLEKTFQDKERFPDEKSREAWRMAELRKIVAAHPFIALRHHINFHHILLPDAPTFFELLGLTRSDRGTMNVLKKRGLFAAADHYFEGKWYLIHLLVPLLAAHGIVIAGCVFLLLWTLFDLRKRWNIWIWWGLFVEFYLFLPGAICAPRYQLPALPCAAVMAALWIVKSAVPWVKYRRRPIPLQPE